MPRGTKVHDTADKIEASARKRGKSPKAAKSMAIATAQKQTGQSYATGKPTKSSGRRR